MLGSIFASLVSRQNDLYKETFAFPWKLPKSTTLLAVHFEAFQIWEQLKQFFTAPVLQKELKNIKPIGSLNLMLETKLSYTDTSS